MGSKARDYTPTTAVTKPRKPSNSKRRLNKSPQVCRRRPTHTDDGASVSDKLEALKNLIPSNNADIKPDQLFQETADYIVLLETQVFVLQKLIDFCGSSQSQENRNAL